MPVLGRRYERVSSILTTGTKPERVKNLADPGVKW